MDNGIVRRSVPKGTSYSIPLPHSFVHYHHQYTSNPNRDTVTEFKAAVQAEYDRITIEQVLKRIMTMPWRCPGDVREQLSLIASESEVLCGR
jgi:hypothetical protein